MSYTELMASGGEDQFGDRVGRAPTPRRMTTSSIPPPRPLGLPEGNTPPSPRGSHNSRPRSRSPLRHSFTSESEEDLFVDARSRPSFDVNGSTPSLSKFASGFLRVGSSVIGGAPTPDTGRKIPRKAPQSPGSVHSSLTDAELEAEALRQKENTRLEAERILTMEAEQRRKEEQRILDTMRSKGSAVSPRSQPSELPPLATAFGREGSDSSINTGNGGSWLSGLAKKLTPTKDLTPAQRIISETKAREKEQEKERKRTTKNGGKAWPASPEAKNSDPTYLALSNGRPSLTSPSGSPSSRLTPSNYSPLMGGSPGRDRSSSMPSFGAPETPTPQRTHGPPGGSPVLAPSPGEPTPLYTVFNDQGTLDVAATLITIARRFEKLEKWSVSHVRALEERMKDVEKYLIEKEGEDKPDFASKDEINSIKRDLSGFRSTMQGLQSEVTGLKAMAAKAPSPVLKPAAPVSVEPSVKTEPPEDLPLKNVRPNVTGQSTTSTVSRSRELPQTPTGLPGRSPNQAQVATSSPTGTPPLVSKPSRSRLPYPSGDYAPSTYSTPSRPTSPNAITSPTMMGHHISASQSTDRSGSESSYVIPERYRSPSPPPPNRASDLALPRTPASRDVVTASPSPTPRKRYTVALSGREDVPSPNNATRGEGQVQTALFSDSPGDSRSHTPESATNPIGFEGVFGHGHGRETTDSTDATAVPDRGHTGSPDPVVGGTAITLSRLSTSPPPSKHYGRAATPPNVRPKSTYTMQSISPSLKSVASSNASKTTQSSPRTPSFRARAQSTFLPLDSVSADINGTTTPIQPLVIERKGGRPASAGPEKNHKRSQSVGLGLMQSEHGSPDNSASPPRAASRAALRPVSVVTPSGQPFVDPLIIRKKSKTSLSSATTPAIKSPVGSKVPFGQLVAFFEADKQ